MLEGDSGDSDEEDDDSESDEETPKKVVGQRDCCHLFVSVLLFEQLNIDGMILIVSCPCRLNQPRRG